MQLKSGGTANILIIRPEYRRILGILYFQEKNDEHFRFSMATESAYLISAASYMPRKNRKHRKNDLSI